jgi:hypothetical protein
MNAGQLSEVSIKSDCCRPLLNWTALSPSLLHYLSPIPYLTSVMVWAVEIETGPLRFHATVTILTCSFLQATINSHDDSYPWVVQQLPWANPIFPEKAESAHWEGKQRRIGVCLLVVVVAAVLAAAVLAVPFFSSLGVTFVPVFS